MTGTLADIYDEMLDRINEAVKILAEAARQYNFENIQLYKYASFKIGRLSKGFVRPVFKPPKHSVTILFSFS